jgi:hypothetical protein
MALRTYPPGEDDLANTRARPISFTGPGQPPGEDAIERAREAGGQGGGQSGPELENTAAYEAANPEGVDDGQPGPGIEFLRLVREAEQQSQLYMAQVNRRAWSQSLRAFHNEHYVGSKYTRPEWRGRSRLFVPKTRAAVRKDLAAVAASLFNNVDAINCLPGNEADPKQRAAAGVMEELVNYRTDRTSGKASLPWFLISMGAREDTLLTGICLSKQCWKQEHRKTGEEDADVDDGNGALVKGVREVYTLDVDRPDMVLFPPENFVIDSAANWLNPAQNAAFVILKYPMTVEEILGKQDAPVNPWKQVSEQALRQAANLGKQDMEAIRRAREMGLDRLDETQTGTEFQIVWVYETFMRVAGEDWTFWSVGDKYYLTDPKPTREVYPEQYGERPLVLGYGNLESHRIFPMSAVESWQPLQVETNDLRNLTLDAVKQNVMPISKVKRGRRIDMDQVKRRSSGSSIFVDDKDDVVWETPPQLGQGPILMGRELDLEFDDLAGQQNYGNVENNNALGKTLGGLKLAAGAANAVQEFDIRVWIETWVEPALAQIVRCEQYYESDPVVLGLCGQRAQLFEKHGISKIDDDLLEQQITIRVSAGLGAGDPQQRLAKFQAAAQIVAPLLAQAPEFQSGQKEINSEAVIEEVFGAAGYKDGGARFFKDNGQPRANPMADLKTQELQAKIAKDNRTGEAAYFTGMAALAKVALGKRELEADIIDRMLGHQVEAKRTGFDHGHRTNQTHLAALEHGHRHGLAIAKHRRDLANDTTAQAGEGAEMEDAAPASPQGAPSGTGPSGPPSASSPPAAAPAAPPAPAPHEALMQLLTDGKLDFTRDPKTGRISGVRLPQQGPRAA